LTSTLNFDLIRDRLQKVESRLRALADVEYPLLASILQLLMASGGKRIRPALVLLAASFYPHDERKVIALATAVETLHTATLVHDDLIDNSLMRRGNPTLNSAWHGGVVVLVGDYLFARSAELAAEAESVEADRLFAQTLAVICDGELRNAFASRRWEVTREEYYQKIYAKTASLFACSTEAAAIVAGAPTRERALLREYGRNLGMAFQIVDDILDFIGTEAELGKPVGSDLRQGTVTLPAIYYVERYSRDNPLTRLASDGHHREEAIQTMITTIRSSSAIDDAYREAREFAAKAKAALLSLHDLPCRQALLNLADYVVERKR